MTEETTKKSKAPAKKVVLKEKSKTVNFFFPNRRSAGFTWQVGSKTIRFVARNSMLVLDGAKDSEAFAIGKLRKDQRNKKNGGTMFIEVADGAITPSDTGSQIDNLIEMDVSMIRVMLGGDLELNRLTKGELIAKVLEID